MTGITIKSSMYHLHIYMKDMVAFEAILHSFNDEKHCYIEVFNGIDIRNTGTFHYIMESTS